jgi:hypothetical protein
VCCGDGDECGDDPAPCHGVDADLVGLAERLGSLSGYPVGVILDERNGPVDAQGLEKVSLTQGACRSLGVYCPAGFGRRRGANVRW